MRASPRHSAWSASAAPRACRRRAGPRGSCRWPAPRACRRRAPGGPLPPLLRLDALLGRRDLGQVHLLDGALTARDAARPLRPPSAWSRPRPRRRYRSRPPPCRNRRGERAIDLDLDAQASQVRQILLPGLARQLGLGELREQGASRLGTRLDDGHRVTLQGQVVRGRQPGYACAHDQHLLARLLRRRDRERLDGRLVDGEPLQGADRDRLVDVAPVARPLARLVAHKVHTDGSGLVRRISSCASLYFFFAMSVT